MAAGYILLLVIGLIVLFYASGWRLSVWKIRKIIRKWPDTNRKTAENVVSLMGGVVLNRWRPWGFSVISAVLGLKLDELIRVVVQDKPADNYSSFVVALLGWFLTAIILLMVDLNRSSEASRRAMIAIREPNSKRFAERLRGKSARFDRELGRYLNPLRQEP